MEDKEYKIKELQSHLEFVRSFYKIAGDWGDIAYMRLNALVEYFEEEIKDLGLAPEGDRND